MAMFSQGLPSTMQTQDEPLDRLSMATNSLVSARNDYTSRLNQKAETETAQAKGGFSDAGKVMMSLGGLASTIPGGQIVGAGLGLLGTIIGLLG